MHEGKTGYLKHSLDITTSHTFKAMTLSGPFGVCVIGLQFFFYSSQIPDNLVGSRPP